MLSWLAVHLESRAIELDLERRSAASLRTAGHEWASVVFSGRDGLLVGYPASQRAAEDALHLVDNVWGVRTVEARFAAAPASEAPLVPLPERKPPLDLLIASTAGPAETARPSDLASAGEARILAAPAEARVLPASEALTGQPPAETLQARDESAAAASASDLPAPPTERSPAPEMSAVQPEPGATSAADADAVPPAAAEAPPAAAEAAAPIPGTADDHAPPGDPAPVAPPAAATQPPTPGASGSSEAPPPSGGPLAVPEETPPVLASPEPRPELAADRPAPPLPEPKAAADDAAPPLPARSPRFETAALPPGNIAADAACLGDVQSAAAGVEVHFAHGDAKLDAAGKAVLDKLVGALNACPQAALRISGHADASGQRRRNLALSRRRARGVARYMVHKGIDAGRLAAVGYGETRPVAPNDTGANRARNRRIEVVTTARAASPPPVPVRKQGTRNGLSHR